jgi:hypothetical protein
MELLTYFPQNAPNMEIKKKRKKNVNPSLFFPKQEIHTLMEVGVWPKKKKFKEKPKHL